MSQTSKKREFPYTEYNKQLHEKYGNMARFIEGCAVPVNWDPDNIDPVELDWHGYPEVIGVKGGLAGILIDEETVAVLDMVQEKIIDTDEKEITVFVHCFDIEHDVKKKAEIMSLYNRLICESLKQQFRAAG